MSATLGSELAAAELDLDRLLTSFDVNFWRVREPGSGLTVGHRVTHQTRLNVVARWAVWRHSTPGILGNAGVPTPAMIVQRPAVVLRDWRRSCTRLHGALTSAGRGQEGWLDRHVDAVRDLQRQLSGHHAQWSAGIGPRQRAG